MRMNKHANTKTKKVCYSNHKGALLSTLSLIISPFRLCVWRERQKKRKKRKKRKERERGEISPINVETVSKDILFIVHQVVVNIDKVLIEEEKGKKPLQYK